MSDDQPTARARPRPDQTARRASSRKARRASVAEDRGAIDLDDGADTQEPRDPMDPGPVASWPPVPTNAQGEPEPESLQQRIRSLYAIDRLAAKEFIFETLHMLLLQRRPMDDIARLFGVTTRTVRKWREQLRDRVNIDWQARYPADIAAEQIANLKRTKSYAWQQAAVCSDPLDKWRWVNTTLKCESEISAIYEHMKMYKAVEPKRQAEGYTDEGTADLASVAREFLTGGYAGAKDKSTKKARPRDPDADLNPELDESAIELGY